MLCNYVCHKLLLTKRSTLPFLIRFGKVYRRTSKINKPDVVVQLENIILLILSFRGAKAEEQVTASVMVIGASKFCRCLNNYMNYDGFRVHYKIDTCRVGSYWNAWFMFWMRLWLSHFLSHEKLQCDAPQCLGDKI